MRITEKGQVTIPQDIRLMAGFNPGTDVTFTFQAGQVLLSRNVDAEAADRTARMRALAVKAKASIRPEFAQMTTDQIMAFIRPRD